MHLTINTVLQWNRAGSADRLFIGKYKFGFVKENQFKDRDKKGDDYTATIIHQNSSSPFDTRQEAKDWLMEKAKEFLQSLNEQMI